MAVGFAKYGDVDDNKLHYSLWRKTTATTAVANQWYDDSMLAGVPVANFYASTPLAAATLVAREGIRHWPADGDNHSEHALEVVAFGNSGTLEAPATYLLVDIVMYYPFLDGDSTDPQDLDNTVTLPRFVDGKGLQGYIVAQGAGAGTGTYSFSYTNQNGTAGRTATGDVLLPTASAFLLTGGGGLTSVRAPFVGLQAGDSGIRSVEQFTWTVAPGGISAFVLCKPIAQFVYAEIGTMAETRFYPRMPAIHPDAFLALLRCPQGATPNARTLVGMLTTIRS
jgi:hypothetical protein